ncbi:Mitochondria protein Fmp29 [Penicillium hordei]|uniref:Mitochondria protein Fmp29 n=1 Tax=Penicillium hordei TaxID=40994 RepID=A0AAD6DP75_9EURO|nr:Mitochondria protein Fmp29 [Penicillium hordei]KAJ5589615.1 Mitochondria protein Fmp29 [Penicillium hordei]
MHIPSLPDDFDEIGIEQQRQCRTVFRLEEANLYYTAATGVHNEEHMDLLRLPHLGIRQYLLRQTGYHNSIGIEQHLLSRLSSCNESEQLLSQVREHLDIDLEGGTEPDNFERAVEGNRSFRIEMVRQAEVDQRELYWRN